MRNYFFAIIAFFLFNNLIKAQNISGSASPNSLATASRDDLKTGSVTGDVNVFNGTFNTGYTLGSINCPGGTSFNVNLIHNSIYNITNNMPFVDGIPYGEGWNIDIPTISVNYVDYHKFITKQLENIPTFGYTTGLCGSSTKAYSPRFNGTELEQEGNYWFAPVLNIPGVASGTLIYKGVKFRSGGSNYQEFVLQTFESFIVAEFDGGTWNVILPNGTTYNFAGKATNFAHATNRRIVPETQGAGANLNDLVVPQTLINKWYISTIYNHNKTETITFTYESFGRFNNVDNYIKNSESDFDLQGMFHGKFSQSTIPTNDVFLTSIYSETEKIVFNYKTHNLGNGNNLLKFAPPTVTRFDSLYNVTTIQKWDPYYGSNSFMDNWFLYRHAKNNHPGETPYELNDDINYDDNNPYSFLLSGITCKVHNRETLGSEIAGVGPKFYYYPGKSGFLESKRFNTNLFKGDMYQIDFNLNAGTQALLDINIATGDNKYPLNSTVPFSECVYRANGESLFTTFDKAAKYVLRSENNQTLTACFNYPNQPAEYGGFAIQIGPSNSDIVYNKKPIDLIFSDGIPVTKNTYYNYDPNNSCYPDYTSTHPFWQRSGSPVSRNFGIGISWKMMYDYYKHMWDPFDLDFVGNKFWWKKIGQGLHINKAIATQSNVILKEVNIKRISKNIYVLDNVQKFVMKDYAGTWYCTDHIKFNYELKSASLYTATEKYAQSPATPSTIKSYIGGARNIVLLRGIRSFPSNATQTVNYSAYPNAPTTTFYYGKKSEYLNGIYTEQNPYSGLITNSEVYTIDSLTNPLGSTTILTYNPIQNPFAYVVNQSNYNTTFLYPVAPNDSSYMMSRCMYLRKYNDRINQSEVGCTTCTTNSDRRQSFPPYSYQLYLTVKEKKVLDKTAYKIWRYKYSGFKFRGSYVNFPQTFFEDVQNDWSPGFSTTKVIKYDNINTSSAIDTMIYLNHTTDFPKWGKTYQITQKTSSNSIVSQKQIKWKASLAYENGIYRVYNYDIGLSIYGEYIDPTRPTRTGIFGSANNTYYTNLNNYLQGQLYYNDLSTLKLTGGAHQPEFYHNKFRTNDGGDFINSFFLRADTVIETEYPTSGSPISKYTVNTYYDADHKGSPISTSAYIALLGSSPTRLIHEPSWGLASSKTYSSELPGVSQKTEYFYLYDLMNKTNFLDGQIYPYSTLPLLKRVFQYRVFSLPLETRVTSIASSGITHVQSTYYTYKILTGTIADFKNGSNDKREIEDTRDINGTFLVIDTISQQIEQLTQPQNALTFNVSTGNVIYPCKIRMVSKFISYNQFLLPKRSEDMTNMRRGIKYNYRGMIEKDTINYHLSQMLITNNTIDNYCHVSNVNDPNNTNFSYSYDNYNRVITKQRNSVTTQTASYNNWVFNNTQTFYERSKQNFVSTTDYITTTLTKQSKSMIDPGGKSILTNVNTYAFDRCEYDNYDRVLYKVKPFIPSGSDPLNFPSPGINEKMEFTYESAPRSRILKSSKYGESISGTTTMKYSYQNISLSTLLSNASTCGQTNTSLLPASGSIFMMTEIKDEDDKKNQTYVDALGRKIAEISGINYGMTIYKYDERGNIASVSNPKNQQTDYVYNYLNYLFSVNSPDEGYSSYAYDKKGRLIAERNSKDEVRVYQYDAFNRMILQARTSYSNAVALFSNQGLDWVTDVSWGTNYLNILSGATPEKRWRYDDYDNTLSSSYFANASPYLTYSKSNTKGRLTQTYSYNSTNGLLIELKFFSYNNDGFLKWEMTQMNDAGISSGSKGRLLRIDYPDYTVDGKVLTKNVDLNGDHTLDFQYYYVYDNYGRLSEVWSNFKNLKNAVNGANSGNKVVAYIYNNETSLVARKNFYQSKGGFFNNIFSETYNYYYDSRFRLTGINSNFFNWSMYYNANNPSVPSGTNISTNYNGNINASVATYNFSTASNSSYLTAFNNAVTYTYTYDALNRLDLADATNVIGLTPGLMTNVGDEDPVYDKIGNITQLSRGINTNGVYSYPVYVYNYNSGNNRLANTTLSGITQRSMGYDNTGNMNSETVGGITSNFSYGRSNLPYQVVKGSQTVSYYYGADDNRIIRVNSSLTPNKDLIIRSIDGQELANYTTGSNSLVWYVQGLNREIKLNHFATLSFDEASGNTSPANGYTTDPFVISINNPTTSLLPDPEYYSYDHLGNAHVVYKMNYNSSGALINPTIQYVADYYAFGKVVREYINTGLSSEKFKFTGKERDSETGLDYFGARYYSSEVGRFTGVDPKSEKYMGWNSYNYTLNNPLNLIDVDGAAPESPMNEYLRYQNSTGEWKTVYLSDKGGNSFDIIHTQYGNIPEVGSSIVTTRIENTNFGNRLTAGVFDRGKESPLEDVDLSDIFLLKGAEKMTIAAGFKFILQISEKDVAKEGAKEGVKFLSDKELAKRLGTTVKDYHDNIKSLIKKDHKELLKKLGTKNPDFSPNEVGNVVMKHPQTGKTIHTDTPLDVYKK